MVLDVVCDESRVRDPRVACGPGTSRAEIALADVLADVVVISSDAEGHGAYMANSWCLTGPVTDYLVDLVVPTDGWSCVEPD